jgi:hypothetical protein
MSNQAALDNRRSGGIRSSTSVSPLLADASAHDRRSAQVAARSAVAQMDR